MIEAVIFDLDNTLVETADLHFICLNIALKEAGIKELEYKFHKEYLCGLPTKDKLNILQIDESKHEEIIFYKQANTHAFIEKLIKPNPQIIEIIDDLFHYQECHLAVVTNCSKSTAMHMLESAGLKGKFSLTLTKEDFKLPKPHAECYTRALIELNTFPDKALIVEDSNYGYQAAMTTGSHVLRINSPSDLTTELIKKTINNIEKGIK